MRRKNKDGQGVRRNLKGHVGVLCSLTERYLAKEYSLRIPASILQTGLGVFLGVRSPASSPNTTFQRSYENMWGEDATCEYQRKRNLRNFRTNSVFINQKGDGIFWHFKCTGPLVSKWR
jgi:hypothetical protein